MIVTDMTDKKLNRAISELLGFHIEHLNGYYYLCLGKRIVELTGYQYADEDIWDNAPEYCTDLDDSMRVQAKAIEVDRVAYVNNLYETCYEFKRVKDSAWDEINIAFLLNASPRQRAEAAYVTLVNQKEDNDDK
ncbi:hypothetical protein D3C74_49610 [compost metagenome]